MTALLSACLPTQPPPPSYQSPVVESIQVSPQPARPGDEVVFTIVVSDDEIISDVASYHLTVPSGTVLPGLPTCRTDVAFGADVRQAVITMACPVPSFASNGTWVADLFIDDDPGGQFTQTGTRLRPTFEVAGGADDNDPPLLLSSATAPAVVSQTTVFSLTVRMSDQAQPLTMGSEGPSGFTFRKVFADNSTIACGNPVFTSASPTETDATFTCTPGNFGVLGRAEAGVHRGFLTVQDALGQESRTELFVNVVAD